MGVLLKLFKLQWVLVSLLLPSYAFAHGEDTHGPNGGYVRMPGAFHTELVPTSTQKLEVYLLDMEWKNPTTKNSSLSGFVSLSKGRASLRCAAEAQVFVCTIPAGVSLKTSKAIVIEALRDGVSGNAVTYELPLKLEASH